VAGCTEDLTGLKLSTEGVALNHAFALRFRG